MRSRLLAVITVALCACASPGTAALTRVSEESTSTKCPTGGVKIDTGTDTDGNGTLDDGEVNKTVEVCNGGAGTTGTDGQTGTTGATGDAGSSGFSSLTQTTVLAAGSTQCLQGGVKIEFGLDDGAGGGTARNGTLETGEVLSTRYVCNGGMPYYPGTTAPPATPAGAYTINASGGDGVNQGGSGGASIVVSMSNGSLGGNVKVFKTGVTDASFTVPALPTFVPGTQPLVVNADTTLNAYGTTAAGIASADPVFQVGNDADLYANVSGNAVVVTGVDVAAGKTLTFSPNVGQTCVVRMHHDLRNAGTITTLLLGDAVSHGHMNLSANNIYGLTGSSVTTAGVASVAGQGGTGGDVTLNSSGRIILQGGVTSSGGDGAPAGNAGAIDLESNGDLTNTGAITARGGVSTSGAGGNGQSVNVVAQLRGLRNSGVINTSGGNGDTTGGHAGNLLLSVGRVGSLYNSGAVTARGGTCSAANCTGGAGGAVTLTGYCAEMRTSGAIDTSGGDGKGTGAGGAAAGITIENYDDNSPQDSGPYVPTGSLSVSGNLSSKGGNGASGGGAGPVTIVLDTYNFPQGQELSLLGYTDLISNGGASPGSSAGNGGQILIQTNDSTWQNAVAGPSGAVINYANIASRGGDGTFAGRGGRLALKTQAGSNIHNAAEVADNEAATVDVRGGMSTNNSGGNGGGLTILGISGVTNAATLSASGGVMSGGVAGGGPGGAVTMYATFGTVSNTGALTLNGGNASGTPGNGGEVDFEGKLVSNTGALSCVGGNGNGPGAQGGTIYMLSDLGNTSTATGAMSVTGGNGTPPGKKGTILIDTVDLTP